MGCNQSRPTGPAFEETRYQITFLPEHEIIGEFGEKMVTNPLNSSSDSYKKEMKQNVYVKSIHSSVAKYVQSYGMNVGDIVEKISVEGPDGFEHKVINLDDTTKSLLNSERPITVTCVGKIYNEKYLQYWKWRIRKDTNENGVLDLNNQGITRNDGIIIGELLKTNNTVKRLNLSNNNITDVESIGEGLKSNNTLEVLLLNNNNIVDVRSIGDALKTNNTLKTLYLSSNNITDDSGIQSIIDGLKTNNTLKSLHLRNTQLSDNMKSQLNAIQQYKRDGSNGYQQVKGMKIENRSRNRKFIKANTL